MQNQKIDKVRKNELDKLKAESAGLQDKTFSSYTFADCDETHSCAGYAHSYGEYFEKFQKKGQGKQRGAYGYFKGIGKWFSMRNYCETIKIGD